jgi:hypothetical protein
VKVLKWHIGSLLVGSLQDKGYESISHCCAPSLTHRRAADSTLVVAGHPALGTLNQHNQAESAVHAQSNTEMILLTYHSE